MLIGLSCAAGLLATAETLDGLLEPAAGGRATFGYRRDLGFVTGAPDRIDLVHTPARQMWDQSYPLRKPPGVTRIALIGDSVARGASYESSIAGRLRALLVSRGRPAEVWSLCSPGYGARRKRLLAEQALRYEPDLLVYHLNVSTEYEDEREWQRYQEHASWHPRNWPDKLPLLGSMRETKTEKFFWNWFSTRARNIAGVDDSAGRVDAMRAKSDITGWMPAMVEQFERTLAIGQEAAVPVLVLVRASVAPNGAGLTDHGLDAIAQAHRRAGQVELVSTREVFTGRPIAEIFSDGAHWHDEGHRLMAEALLEPAIALLRNRTMTRPTRAPRAWPPTAQAT